MNEEFKANVKASLWVITVLPALVEGVFGFVRAIRDGIRRIKGEKTTVQIAVENHLQKCGDEFVRELIEKVKNGDGLPDDLKMKIQKGEI